MSSGKVSNSVLKRSVLKQIKKRNDKVQKPAIGVDCGIIDVEDTSKRIVVSQSCGRLPVYRAVNNIYANGGIPEAVECCVIMPEELDEQELKKVMKELDDQCEVAGVQIAGGHTQISEAVKKPIITVAGIGYSNTDIPVSARNMKAGQNIVMTKWIGIGGIRAVIEKHRDSILDKYSEDVIDKAYGAVSDMLIDKEAAIALQMGVESMHDVSEGGIYAALWDMSEAGKAGLDVDFRKIAVRQEIIEICELLDINPYELESDGCLLMTVSPGCDIIDKLQAAGIKACIIGKVTDNNDKIIRNLDEVRYLDTPKRDEIYRFM